MLIEDMCPDDWDSVRRIYEEGLATGDASFEVEAPPWPAWDERHHGHSRLVARAAGRVVGWAAPSYRRSGYLPHLGPENRRTAHFVIPKG